MTELKESPIVTAVQITRRSREEFHYRDSCPFNTPVIVTGSDLQFLPDSQIVRFDEETDGFADPQALINRCSEIESLMRLEYVESMEDLRIIGTSDTILALQYQGQNFALQGGTLAFRHFSTLLGVPASYSSKSPGHLNQMNFEYWQHAINQSRDLNVALNLVYQDKVQTVSVSEAQHTPMQDFEVFPLYTVLRAKEVGHGKKKVSVEKPLNEMVPLWADILTNLRDMVFQKGHQIKVQSFALGYTGENKGRHYVRMILDSLDTSFIVDGEKFHLALNLDTDFIGTHANNGQVYLSFGLLRPVCSNGLVVQLEEAQKIQFRDSFAKAYVAKALREYPKTDEESAFQAGQRHFESIYDGKGVRFPVPLLNTGFDTSGIRDLLGLFLGSTNYMSDRISSLMAEFPETAKETFVATLVRSSKKLGVPNKIIKALASEYIAGQMTGDLKFRTPMDICNFVTLLGQSYPSEKQTDLSSAGVGLAQQMKRFIIEREFVSDEALYQQYASKVREDSLI